MSMIRYPWTAFGTKPWYIYCSLLPKFVQLFYDAQSTYSQTFMKICTQVILLKDKNWQERPLQKWLT